MAHRTQENDSPDVHGGSKNSCNEVSQLLHRQDIHQSE